MFLRQEKSGGRQFKTIEVRLSLVEKLLITQLPYEWTYSEVAYFP